MALSASDRRFAASLRQGAQLLAEVNRRRREDWDMVIAGYAVLGSRPAEPDPVPRSNGFTPRRPTIRRELSRPPVRPAARHEEAEKDAAMARSLARLRGQGIHTGG